MIWRGEVYDARLDPVEGTEQAGVRPVVVVSRDSVNEQVDRIVGVPCTRYRAGLHVYPSRALLTAPDGGLRVDSIALCEQVRVLSVRRLIRRRGALSAEAVRAIDTALLIALDLPEPD